METRSYSDFWQRIHRIAKEKRFPLRVMFELTYRCNFNCLHCYVPKSFKRESERKDLKTKEIYHILDQLREAGCFYLGFTGGEPFLRQDILDILRYAKAKGFEIMIYTNASLIDKKIADELKKLRPNKVDITINSLKKERFEKITRTPGSYERVFRTIELLHKRNIPLGFKSCVLKYNEDEIRNISKFSESHHGLYRLDTMLMPRLDGSEEPYRYRGELREDSVSGNTLHVSRSTPNVLRQKCNLEECDIKTKPRTTNQARLFNCGVGLHNLVINPFGELKMCIHINYPRYNILEASLERCWQRLKERVDSIKADENYECAECQLRSYCRWCPARAWLRNGRFTCCVPESKKRAEYNRRMAQGEKIPLKLIENHDQAYHFWKKLGISNKPLIHFDAHIDFNFHPAKSLKQTLEEAKSKQGLLRQLSQNLAYKQLNIKEESLTNIGNYIYPAMRDGIVSDFYWVIPGERQEFKGALKNLCNILRAFFSQDPFKTGRIAKEKGMLKAEIYGRKFIVTTLQDLPKNIGETIVDIDCDYLTIDTVKKATPSHDIGRRFPWIWPEALVDRLKSRLCPSCITIAYSVNGGFTPLAYKFLGDETAFFFNGISQSLKKIISIKNEALVSFKKGKIKESVDMLKSALRNLDVVKVNHGLKNRLKAHLAFVLFRCFVALNNLTKARRYYKLAVSSDKTYRVKDNNYGPLYLRKRGGLKKAEREFNIILFSSGKADSYALCGLADIFMRRKDFAKATALFKKAYRLDRKNQEALLGISRVELLLKNYKTALRYLKNSKSYSLLAQAYEGLGRFDAALKKYKLALYFGINLNLYMKFFKLLKKTGIPEEHKEWIEGRINTYKNYKKSFFRLEKNGVMDQALRNRKKRLISRIDSILYELDAI